MSPGAPRSEPMNVRKASIRIHSFQAGNITTPEGHELLRNRRHFRVPEPINEMEERGTTVAPMPSFHELQCLYWHGPENIFCSITDPRAPRRFIPPPRN